MPTNDLQTVIVERSFYWDQNSFKVRIRPGFTNLSRIVSQTLQPFQDEQAIELEADISTSTSPVTIDVLHHGMYHFIGNVDVLNVLQSSSDQVLDDHANMVEVQIKGNVNSGNITRPGMYTIFGNITGSLRVDTKSVNNETNNDDNDDIMGAAVLITTSSCDTVTLLGGLGDDTCSTVTAATLTNTMMMNNPRFFALQCTLLACQETGVIHGDDDVNKCHVLTQCPIFGQTVRVNKNAAMTMPGSAAAAAAAAPTTSALIAGDGNWSSSRLSDLVLLAVLNWAAVSYFAS